MLLSGCGPLGQFHLQRSRGRPVPLHLGQSPYTQDVVPKGDQVPLYVSRPMLSYEAPYEGNQDLLAGSEMNQC